MSKPSFYKNVDRVESSAEEPTESRPLKYVEFRMILNFPFIGLRLMNSNYEILRLNFTHIVSRFEIRPVAKSFYFLLNARSIDAFGVYYKDCLKNGLKNELVPLIKSKSSESSCSSSQSKLQRSVSYVPTETSKEMFFTFAFETNPIDIENVEFSIRTNVSSLKVYYEKTSITELLNFFKSDLIGFEDVVNVKKIKENVWSKAGVMFAVENHKQFHISAELSSPYFIIPVKGTLQEVGHSIVFFLGKTTIKSDIQPKQSITSLMSVSQLEKNFYDKLKLSVNDVQAMLVPYNVKLDDYLKNCQDYGFKYHLLYPVSTENTVFLSIDPKYKKLPKLRIDAVCPSIQLNFSDNKIIKLIDFAQKFPLPDMPKSSVAANSAAMRSFEAEPVKNTKKNEKEKFLPKAQVNSKTGQPQEPDNEWEGPFMLPKSINGDPILNYSQLLFNFEINKFAIDIKETDDCIIDEPVEHDYLGLNFKDIKLKFAITKYGFNLKAGLGNLKLIDKVHRTSDNKFTEFLSSTSKQLIRLHFRQVEVEAPNFSTLYANTLSKMLFECSSIQLVCHRTAIIYFINYSKRITDNLTIANKEVSLPNHELDHIDLNNRNVMVKKIYDIEICELSLEANMKELTWKMYDNELLFGNMQVKDLGVSYYLSGIKTDVMIKLKTIFINYEGISINNNNDSPVHLNAKNFDNSEMCPTNGKDIREFYKQIISCTAEKNAENFFDFRLVIFDTPKHESQFKDSISLKIGQIKVICLVKFVNELIQFIEPIINPIPNLTEQLKDQAIEAAHKMKNVYQETQTEGRQIYLDINLSSPMLIIPKNSASLNGFLVLLGNLTVKNKFIKEHTIDKQTIIIDEIGLFLTDVKVKRIKYPKNMIDQYSIIESVVEPVNLSATCRRALTETVTLPDLKISFFLSNLVTIVSLVSAKLLFAILDENLNEGISQNAQVIVRASTRKSIETVVEPVSKKQPILNQEINVKDDAISKRLDLELHMLMNQIVLKIVILKTDLLSDNFSDMEISQVDFNYFKYVNGEWDAYFKMKALHLNDTRPDSNLAVKEYNNFYFKIEI